MTRVVHVLWSGGVGGIERFVHDLAIAQRDAGTDVRIAFARAEGPFADRLRTAGVSVVDLGFRSGYDVRPWVVARARRMLDDTDIVHVHALNVPLAATIAGRRVVYTDHGSVPVRRTPALAAKRLVQRSAFARAAAVTAPSRYAADRTAAIHGVARERVTVVPNGIAPPEAGVEQRDHDDLVIAVVGRLARTKRIDRVLEAVAHMERKDARVVIAGAGPLEAEVRATAERLGIAPRVDLLGAVGDIERVYSSADVLVLPSSGEIFGLVVVEAAASGVLPIVFADVGGALEILPPDGLVVRDEVELAATLDALPGSDSLANDARRARAEWARETFAIERAVERFDVVYRSALRA